MIYPEIASWMKKVDRTLEKLRGFDVPRRAEPVWIYPNDSRWVGTANTPLTSTSWDGDARSTTGATLIDLSAVFGVPAGVKAVLVKIVARDSVAVHTQNWFQIGPAAANTNDITVWTVGGDLWVSQTSICGCDANGDIYFQCNASGVLTLDAVLEVRGYAI